MSEWKEYKLGEVVQSVSDTYKFKPREKVVFLNTSDIFDGRFLTDVKSEVSTLPGQAKKRIQRGDILFSEIRPANRRFAMVNFDCDDYVVSTKLMVLRCNDKIDIKFLYLFLTSKDVLEYLQMVAEDRSGTFPQITFDIIANMDISLPPIDEQKRIAGVLSSLDDKIDLLNQENATLEALAETLFRHYFIENPNPTWKEGKLESVVEVFDSRRKPLSKMERDKMKKGTILYPYYGAAEIMDYIDEYLFDGEFILLGEDGTVRTDNGYPILQLATGKFWPNNHAHVLQAKKPFDNCFLWYYFKTTNIDEIVTGAVQPKINQANLMSLPIYDYPIDQVEEFQTKAVPIWNKIKYNQQQMKTLAAQRDVLLPRLMSGDAKVTRQ